MAVPLVIKDPKSGNTARVTRFGQLVTTPLAYSVPVTQDMDVIDTAFNFAAPREGQSIVITGMFLSANNSVSNTTPAEVEIYTSDAADSTTVIRSILQPRLVRSSNVSLTGLNLLIGPGVWVNGKTNDNDILLTVMFYRVPVESL